MTTTTRLKRCECHRRAPAKCAWCAGRNIIKSARGARVGHSSSFVLAIIAIELLTNQATPAHQVPLSASGNVPFKTSFISSSDHYHIRRNNPLIPLEYAEIESQQNQQMPDSIALNSPSFEGADSMFGLDAAETNFLRLQRTASRSNNNNYKQQHDDLLVASSQLVGDNTNSSSGSSETTTKVATANTNNSASRDPQPSTTTEAQSSTTLGPTKPIEQESAESQANGTTSGPDLAPSGQQTLAGTSTTTAAPAANKNRDVDSSVTTLEVQATTVAGGSSPTATTLAPTPDVLSAATTSAPTQSQDKRTTSNEGEIQSSTPAPARAESMPVGDTAIAVADNNQRDGRTFKSNASASFEFNLAPSVPLFRTNKTKNTNYENQLLIGEKSFPSNRTKLEFALQEPPKAATTLRLCDSAKSDKCGEFLVASVPVLVGNHTNQSASVNEFIFVPADSSAPLSFDESTFAAATNGSANKPQTNQKTTPSESLENLKAEHRQIDGDGDAIDLVELDYITSDGVGESGVGGSSQRAAVPEAGERASTRPGLQATGDASSTSGPVSSTSTTTATPVASGANKEGQRSSPTTVAQSHSTSAPAPARPGDNATLITYSDSQSISVKGDNLYKGGDKAPGLSQQSSQPGAGLSSAAAAADVAQQRQPAVRKSVRENQKVMRVVAEPLAQRAAPPTTTTKRPAQQAKLEPSRAPIRSTTRRPRSQHRNYFSEPAGQDQRRRVGVGAPRTRAAARTYSPINNGADEEEASILTRYAISPTQLSRISPPGSAAAGSASRSQQPAAANYRRLEAQPDRRHQSSSGPTARIGQQLSLARPANPADTTLAEAARGARRPSPDNTSQLDQLVTAALKRQASESTGQNKFPGADSGSGEPTLASGGQLLNEELLTLISSSIGNSLGDRVRSLAPTGDDDNRDASDDSRTPQPPPAGRDNPKAGATAPIAAPLAPTSTAATPAESDNRATSSASTTAAATPATSTAAPAAPAPAAIVAPKNGTEPRAPLLDDSSASLVVENSTEVDAEPAAERAPTSDAPVESRRQLINVYGQAGGAGVGQQQAAARKAGESSGPTRSRQQPAVDDGMWRPDEELDSGGALADLAAEYLSATPGARTSTRAKQAKRQRASDSSETTTTSTTASQQGAANVLPGRPGIDYPIHWQVPKTSFDCLKYERSGFYADVESNCQAYHSCHRGRGGRHTFLCPNGTLFSQELLTCDWWYNVECSASKLYAPNEHGGSSVNLDAGGTDGSPGLLLDIGRSRFASNWRQ